jgi:hypothetical protein
MIRCKMQKSVHLSRSMLVYLGISSKNSGGMSTTLKENDKQQWQIWYKKNCNRICGSQVTLSNSPNDMISWSTCMQTIGLSLYRISY